MADLGKDVAAVLAAAAAAFRRATPGDDDWRVGVDAVRAAMSIVATADLARESDQRRATVVAVEPEKPKPRQRVAPPDGAAQ